MSDLRRIAIIMNDWSSPGGVARVGEMLVHELRKSHEVKRVGVWGGGDTRPLLAGLPFNGLWRLCSFVGLSSKLARLMTLNSVWAARRLKAVCKDEPTTLVVAMDVLAAEVVASAAYRSATTVAQFHNSFTALSSGRDLSRFEAVGRHLTHLLMLTEADASALAERCGRSVGWIPNAVDLPVLSEQDLRRESTARVVAVGRLVPAKDFELLIRAWNIVVSELPGARLDIFGSGPLEKRLRALIQSERLPDIVALRGHSDDVVSELRSADLLVMTSRYEGLPLVITEAFSQGVPVVSTAASPGVCELIDLSGAGWLVRERTPDAVARQIVDALGDVQILNEKRLMGLDFAMTRRPERIALRWIALGCPNEG